MSGLSFIGGTWGSGDDLRVGISPFNVDLALSRVPDGHDGWRAFAGSGASEWEASGAPSGCGAT